MTRKQVLKKIILDRDGVINIDSPDYVKSSSEFIPLPGSLEAIAKLTQNGYEVAVATNQSAIARGLLDEAELKAIHSKLYRETEAKSGKIAGIFYCPHGPDEACKCRKPKPGLLLKIQEKLNWPLPGIPFVGDSLRDLQAGHSAGCQPVLVLTGNGRKTLQQIRGDSHWKNMNIPVYESLADYADFLIGQH